MTKTQTTKGPFADGMMRAADLLKANPQQIRLACGELTANEMRVAQAILGWKETEIRREAERDNGYGF